MQTMFMQEIHGTVASVPAGDHLNVRVKPEATSDAMAQVDDGCILTVLGEELTGETKWLLVTVGDKTGWVNSRYVRL